MTQNVIMSGRGHTSGLPVVVTVADSGDILRPYEEVISFGPTAVAVTDEVLYAPPEGFAFVMNVMVLSAIGGQVFTFTCGAWRMSIFLGIGALGGTEVIPYVNGGLQFTGYPLLLTTANAVNTSVAIVGRRVTR